MILNNYPALQFTRRYALQPQKQKIRAVGLDSTLAAKLMLEQDKGIEVFAENACNGIYNLSGLEKKRKCF